MRVLRTFSADAHSASLPRGATAGTAAAAAGTAAAAGHASSQRDGASAADLSPHGPQSGPLRLRQSGYCVITMYIWIGRNS